MSAPSVVPVVGDVELPAGVLGPHPVRFDVRCYLVPHDAGLVLIDTGIDPEAVVLGAALAELGAAWGDITDVVLTHGHVDHVGGLETVVARAPDARVWAGAGETAGGRRVADGRHVRGLRVVETPGHTPGHLALFDEDRGLLFTGDALGNENGTLTQGPPAFIADSTQARRSLERLEALGAGRMLFGHGAELPDPLSSLRRHLAELGPGLLARPDQHGDRGVAAQVPLPEGSSADNHDGAPAEAGVPFHLVPEGQIRRRVRPGSAESPDHETRRRSHPARESDVAAPGTPIERHAHRGK